MDCPQIIRNITIAGHLHHGKVIENCFIIFQVSSIQFAKMGGSNFRLAIYGFTLYPLFIISEILFHSIIRDSFKTTFIDCLMEQTHPEFVRGEDTDTRYTDTLFIEQQRGCSIKATPITIVMQDSRFKSFLLNIMDTPGNYFYFDS